MSFKRLGRVLHRRASVLVALPLLVVIGSGILLLLKKEIAWIQPPTQRGTTSDLGITFDRILEIAATVPEAGIRSWEDIDRLDVRPSEGMLKIRARNRWEIQLDARTGEILQVAYRRSDLIESLHDGTFFHDGAKLWVFLPGAVLLLGMWLTGIYLFVLPHLARRKRRQRADGVPGARRARDSTTSTERIEARTSSRLRPLIRTRAHRK